MMGWIIESPFFEREAETSQDVYLVEGLENYEVKKLKME